MEKTIETFVAPEKTILVKPIMRVRNQLITDPEHEAFFLFGSATTDYSLPVDRQNNLHNPFSSKEEQLWLEKELDLDLNFHKSSNNYWHKFKVKLGKDNKKLSLRNPKDYLQWLVLKANTLYIAPSGEEMGKKATYRYALVSEDFETKKIGKKSDMNIEAYMALGKIKEDRDDMVNFLKVYGKKVSPMSKKEFLVAEIMKVIEEDVEGFLDIMRNKSSYDVKLLIADAVDCGAIIKQGRKYSLPGGDVLCSPGLSPTLDNAVEYLTDKANQEILLTIKTRVKTAKD